jgi:hypothetical protein
MDKTCRECSETKPISEFPKLGGGRYRPYCKVCYNVKQAEYREKNRDRLRSQWREASRRYYEDKDPQLIRRVKRHGITVDEYESLLESQGGTCAICGASDNLVIDHCHDRLEVRGILCDPCNRGLGCFADSTGSLMAAIVYLTNPPASGIITKTPRGTQ